jgi:hypothetical protein
VAQITLYLPDEVAAKLKAAAKRAGHSVSGFVTALAERELAPAAWPAQFERAYGSWQGDFPECPDPPPDTVAWP